jgi:hypothetical protein
VTDQVDHPAHLQPVSQPYFRTGSHILRPSVPSTILLSCPSSQPRLHLLQRVKYSILSGQTYSKVKSYSVPEVSTVPSRSGRALISLGRSGICYTITEILMRLGADAVIVGRE